MYLDLNQPLQYQYANLKQFAPGERHCTRVARENVLILMLEGTLYFTEEDREEMLRAGEYYIQKQGLRQSALRESDAVYFFVHFNGTLSDFSSPAALAHRGTFDIQKIYPIADKLCREETLRAEPRAYRTALFLTILSDLCRLNRSPDETMTLAEGVHTYLSEHFCDPIDIASLSARFSYSGAHIIRVFRRHYNMTPHAYLLSRRIDYAKILLSTTDKSIADIASLAGFSDLTTFWRAFRSKVGMSPKEWRS